MEYVIGHSHRSIPQHKMHKLISLWHERHWVIGISSRNTCPLIVIRIWCITFKAAWGMLHSSRWASASFICLLLFCCPLTLEIKERAAQTPTSNNCEWLSLLLSAFNESPRLSSTKFYYKQPPVKGLCSSLNGVKTSAAWLAPHLFSLMEGGGLVAEWKHTDTQSEWQTCHLITDSPLAFTLMSSRRLLKQGEVKKNQT